MYFIREDNGPARIFKFLRHREEVSSKWSSEFGQRFNIESQVSKVSGVYLFGRPRLVKVIFLGGGERRGIE